MRKNCYEVGNYFNNRLNSLSNPPNWKISNQVPTRRIRPKSEVLILNQFVGWHRIFLPFVVFWIWWNRNEKT